MPGIHVPTEHHDLVFQRWIAAGNFGDCVVAIQIFVLPFDGEVNVHFHFLAGLDHAYDAIVVFDRDHNLRNNLRRVLVVRIDSLRSIRPKRVWRKRLRHGGRLHENRAAIAGPTRINEQGGAFIDEELIFLCGELLRRQEICVPIAAETAAASAWSRHRSVRQSQ